MVATKKIIANDLFFASVEQLIAEGQRVELTVKGFSMRPFLRNEKDVVVLAPIAPAQLRVGMVILFRYRGGHVLHRIRKIEGERLTFEGDGNYRIQELAQAADVVAYVAEVKLAEGGAFGYDSPRWRRRSARSLCRKRVRTLAIGIKRKLLK